MPSQVKEVKAFEWNGNLFPTRREAILAEVKWDLVCLAQDSRASSAFGAPLLRVTDVMKEYEKVIAALNKLYNAEED